MGVAGLSLPALVLALAIVALPASARTLVVSPDGEQNVLAKAQAAAAADPTITAVVLAPGRYPLAAPVLLEGRGRRIVWRSARPGAAILDGGGVTPIALIVGGRNIAVGGLTIRGFTQDGIRITNADHVTISANHITDISSTGWSQGAIHGLTRASHVTIAGNVIERSGYAGIVFDTGIGGDLSALTIVRNRVIDTCRTKADCGAIYVGGRSGANRDTLIARNVVRDFGPAANATKGIYLDDGLSGAIVRGNDVSGHGSFALQIHGGSDNRIEHNRFASTGRFLLYQRGGGAAPPPMRSNVIRANRLSSLDVQVSGADMVRPDLSGNRLIR